VMYSAVKEFLENEIEYKRMSKANKPY